MANGITPVFTYYLLRQSAPGNSIGDDGQANETNMQNTSTMAAYYNDLKLLFPRSGAFPNNRVVVHLEPDLWGFLQRRASGDNATTPTRTATPSSGSTTVTFDDRPGQNVVLNGPYPSGVINWGQAASGTTRGRGGASPRRV